MAARRKRSSSAAVAHNNKRSSSASSRRSEAKAEAVAHKRSSSAAVAHNSLARYRQKRNFAKTPEPAGVARKKTGHRYLIQKHAATRLHYDFRLELGGVLKSWAVTRGPSLDPQVKRLAVEVEDHPVSYGSFEGIIPKGQYGGGTVMLWDEGSWEPIGDPHAGLEKGKLEFKLHGKRLTGEWTLVRMHDREKDKGRHNWLLIKHRDDAAHTGDNDKLLTKNVTSIVSGRTMEKIAAAEDRVWQSKPRHPERSVTKSISRRSQDGKKMPAFKPPQLATLTDSVPQGEDWVHEIKFDGYRGLTYIQNGKVRIYTRTGQDWTHKFRSLTDRLAKLPVKTAILDGEIVALDDKGASSFKALQNTLSEGQDNMLQYYVFDLLYLDGKDISELPLVKRKALLAPLLTSKIFNGRIIYSEHVTAKGDAMLKRMCSMNLEGVVSKRADAPYSYRRSTSWLKTKCHKRQEFVIGGFTLPTHAERGIGALLIGYYDNGKFIYAGKVGTGFDNETSLGLRKKLDKFLQKTMAFNAVPTDGRRGAKWVTPKFVCEVEFTEWTPDGRLRHPSFQGLREDKPAVAITRDIPIIPKPRKQPENSKVTVGGITITHPDRIIYPGTEITKSDLAEYYLAVAEHILPHVKNRPLSMVRCPEGIAKECFFQRHIAREQSPYLYDTGIKVKGRNESYLMIKDVKGLITLVQWGVIELHPWGCLADKPELPDRIIFDLDPDPALPFTQVIEGAKEIRTRMQEFGLKSFVKTTGGKGLHVVIPMTRAYSWEPIKAFARAIADSMQHDDSRRYIAKANKDARKGKIFVDYLRNDLTSTSVAAFSARAREGAPVAVPMDWSELKTGLKPAQFTIETLPARLQRKDDPWAEFFEIRQKISTNHLYALRIKK
jgi:bifunctional non-homologous end joining protein LigD